MFGRVSRMVQCFQVLCRSIVTSSLCFAVFPLASSFGDWPLGRLGRLSMAMSLGCQRVNREWRRETLECANKIKIANTKPMLSQASSIFHNGLFCDLKFYNIDVGWCMMYDSWNLLRPLWSQHFLIDDNTTSVEVMLHSPKTFEGGDLEETCEASWWGECVPTKNTAPNKTVDFFRMSVVVFKSKRILHNT